MVVGFASVASLWGVRAWMLNDADDRGLFYSHEESLDIADFNEIALRSAARDAEAKAALGGADRSMWLAEAKSLRTRAAD